MDKGAGGNHPPHFEKLRVAKLIYPPFFSSLNLFFYFIMETYIVQLAKGNFRYSRHSENGRVVTIGLDALLFDTFRVSFVSSQGFSKCGNPDMLKLFHRHSVWTMDDNSNDTPFFIFIQMQFVLV